MTRRAVTYTTLAGEWGWTCPACRAESRYVYGSRHKARRLARLHDRYCRGAALAKAVRR